MSDDLTFLHDGAYDAWTAYTPTVKLGATTVSIQNDSKKTTFGKLQIINIAFRFTNLNAGTGTMTVTVPTRRSITNPANSFVNTPGFANLFDLSSVSNVYGFLVSFDTNSTIVFRSFASPGVVLTNTAPITIAAGASGTGDEFYATVMYELA
jgi:hypothetical protein